MSEAAIGEWALRTLLGGGFLLLAAGLAMSRLGAPARRQRLGEWAIVAALLLAPLSLAPAWLIVTLPAPITRTESTPSVVVEPEPPHLLPAETPPPQVGEENPLPFVGGFVAMEAEAPNVGEEAAPAPPPADVRSEQQAPTAAPSPPADGGGHLWRGLQSALLLYLTGSALLLAHWLLGHAVLWRLLRRGEPAPPAVADLFASMTRGCHRPRLVLSRQAHVPFSCGVLRPTVVLPAGLARKASPRLLRWIFAHELTHLRRHDARASVLFGLGQMLYFPLPWFWRLRRQVRLCQEYIADAAAAALGCPEDYAQFLVGWTAAPRPPAGVAGVGGSSSDLFRRITMLLQAPAPVEPHCPRRWSLLAAGTLLGLAVLVAGVGLAVQAAPVPQKKDTKKDKDATKKDDAKKTDADKESDPFEAILKNPPEGVDPAMIRNLREGIKNSGLQMTPMQIKQMIQQMGQMRQMRFAAVAPPPAGMMPPGMWNPRRSTRLGARIEPPSATLAEQLDLPKGKGLVVKEVLPNSAAKKAGLKVHDILLELNGEKVPNKVEGLTKLMADIKADTAVDAVVLRKGKKETIKGLKLPEAKEEPGLQGVFPVPPGVAPAFAPPAVPAPPNPPGFPGAPLAGIAAGWMAPGAGGRTVMTTMFRTEDRFTTRHQEGSLIITLTGKAADGKAKVGEIRVQDGGESSKYTSVDKVPEHYRDKVKNLIEMSEKSGVRIEIKSP